MGNNNRNTKGNRHGGTADRQSRLALVVLAIFAILFAVLAFASCNVTRTVTTSAQTIQRGDTTTIIQTRTIEQYDGAVDASKLLKR